MQKLLFLGSIILLLLASCKGERHPQVVYSETDAESLSVDDMMADTTKVLVVGLPVDIDSTDIIIHPVAWENIYPQKVSSLAAKLDMGYSKKGYSDYERDVYFDGRDHISGIMINLIFEDVKTGSQKKLTDNAMIITSASYLRTVAKKIDKHYLLYTAYDKDYNRDGKLDGLDLTAYYISNLDGTNFTKLTEDYHSVDRTSIMLKNNRYYFRTLEDVNRDGLFNKTDKFHHYYVDLAKDAFKVVEYFPLELLK